MPDSDSGGHGFESRHVHHNLSRLWRLFLLYIYRRQTKVCRRYFYNLFAVYTPKTQSKAIMIRLSRMVRPRTTGKQECMYSDIAQTEDDRITQKITYNRFFKEFLSLFIFLSPLARTSRLKSLHFLHYNM